MASRKTYIKLTLKNHEPITFNSDMLLKRVQPNGRRSLHGILHYDHLLDIINSNSIISPRFRTQAIEGFYPEILMLSIAIQSHKIDKPDSSIEFCPKVDQNHSSKVIDLTLMIRFYEYDDVTNFEQYLYRYFYIDSVENDS